MGIVTRVLEKLHVARQMPAQNMEETQLQHEKRMKETELRDARELRKQLAKERKEAGAARRAELELHREFDQRMIERRILAEEARARRAQGQHAR